MLTYCNGRNILSYEYVNIIKVTGAWDGNYKGTARLYAQQFLNVEPLIKTSNASHTELKNWVLESMDSETGDMH
jgi:hypothetical protein